MAIISFVPEIRKAVENKDAEIKAYVVGDTLKEVTFTLGDMTDAEREIILKGCLINYYKGLNNPIGKIHVLCSVALGITLNFILRNIFGGNIIE